MGFGFVTIGSIIRRNNLVYDFAYSDLTDDFVQDLIDVAYDDQAFANYVKYNSRLGNYGNIGRAAEVRYAIKLVNIFELITVALAIFTAIMTVIDLCRDRSIEQLPIPNYLVNNYTDEDGGSYSINYKAVECNRMNYFGKSYKKQKGNCADLNADEGKQWLVLYASKNSMAGKPLTPDFVIQTTNQAPAGYDGFVHLIGEKGAVNVVSNAFKNYSTLSSMWQRITGDYSTYIFNKLSNDVKTYDESAGNMTASALGNGMWAIFGFGGLIIGGALGAVIAVMINKNKKKKETAI